MMNILEKKYHFYAAHRNENLNDKCFNIHGHTYYVTLELIMPEPDDKTGVTILFSDVDKLVEPIIKQFDHTFIIHVKDPLLKFLYDFNASRPDFEQELSLFVLASCTSLENITEYLWTAIETWTKLRIYSLKIQETTSSSFKKTI